MQQQQQQQQHKSTLIARVVVGALIVAGIGIVISLFGWLIGSQGIQEFGSSLWSCVAFLAFLGLGIGSFLFVVGKLKK